MIKQTFIITEEEKERILNLHISATENNYLTEQNQEENNLIYYCNKSDFSTVAKLKGFPPGTFNTDTLSRKTCLDLQAKYPSKITVNYAQQNAKIATQPTVKTSNPKTTQTKVSTLPSKPKQNDLLKVDKSAYAASVDSTAVNVGVNPITGQKITTQKTYVDPNKLVGPTPNDTIDDTIEIISAIIDLIPGIGTAVSAGIDILHAISYVTRGIQEKITENKIVYFIKGLFGLGMALIPEAGNAANLSFNTFIKTYLSWWDELIGIIRTFVNEKKVTKAFLDWLNSGSIIQKITFAFTFLLKRLGINVTVSQLMTEASTQLGYLKNYLSGIYGLEWLVTIISGFQKYLTPPSPSIESSMNTVLSDPKISVKMKSMFA